MILIHFEINNNKNKNNKLITSTHFFTILAVPILADEPGLRLLSLQHNLIKRIQHLDTTFRLVFLDLYHNRLDQIGSLEPLTNLRVLMLGKNRIRRIEGLQKCNRLSVLDLHGNRITQVTCLALILKITTYFYIQNKIF
jgi:leucine-rich repeat-containing protein 49